MSNTDARQGYQAPRLKFLDEKAFKTYVDQYPEIEKLANEMATTRSVTIVAITAVDVATLYYDVKYYNG